MNILKEIQGRFSTPLTELTEDSDSFVKLIKPTQDTRHGDYQANCAMPLQKQLGCQSQQIASEIIKKLKIDDICESEIVGKGFINLRLKTNWMIEQLGKHADDEQLGVVSAIKPKKYVIDYSSPNIAKPMHVGHIRSTVIGDSLARILRFLGHKVITDNHLGDWGTQFGMIIYGYKNFVDKDAYASDPVSELSRLYLLVNNMISEEKKFDVKPIAAAVLQETARLHSGDKVNHQLWEKFLPHCQRIISKVYDRLGVKFDYEYGESFYQNMLMDVVADFHKAGLIEESDGAKCIFMNEFDSPMIVQKKDGAFLYATTDLATIKYRIENWSPDAILYVVDSRQSEHFQKLFSAARKWGYEDVELTHVNFGTVMDKQKRPFKTRNGDAASLEDLLDDAIDKAAHEVASIDDGKPQPELSAEQRKHIAEVVGHGAVKYADLSHNRTSDYVFDFDKMTSLTGNTATYMIYSYARVQSIFKRGKTTPQAIREQPWQVVLEEPVERALAMKLLRFPEVVAGVQVDYRPNLLAAYLYELAKTFSVFFEQCNVLKSEKLMRISRLQLCELTARTLHQGLYLLGIDTVDKM